MGKSTIDNRQSEMFPERLYSPYQVASLLGVTEGEVLAWIQKGLLAVHRFPDESVRVRQRGLVDFLRRQGINLKAILTDDGNGDGAGKTKPAAEAFEEAVDAMTAEVAESQEEVAEVAQAASSETIARSEPTKPKDKEPSVELPAADDERHTKPASAAVGADSAQQIVSAVLQEALDRKAEAVLLELRGQELSLRVKTGGVVYDKPNFRALLKAGLAPKIIAFVRSLAGLAAEAADCASGRFTFSLAGREGEAEFRLECCPTASGQRLAIFPKVGAARPLSLSELGLAAGDLVRLRDLARRQGRLIVLAGPARSGRSTLLEAIAAELPEGLDVASVERKASLSAGGGNFTRTRPHEGGAGFDELLESLVRQECGAILVDDMRHRRTICRAIAAAMEGRLVVATMRAGGCADVLHLLEQALGSGEEARWDLASALGGVVTCRLGARLCENCRREVQPSAELLAEVGLKELKRDVRTQESAGCGRCSPAGRSGVVGMYSVAVADSKAADAIRSGSRAAAVAEAMICGATILDAGLEKVSAGLMSLSELARQMRL